MKRKTYFCIHLCIISIALFYWSCTDVELAGANLQAENKDFSLQEAKEFFENQMEHAVATTRSIKPEEDRRITPGTFIPKWENAIASSSVNLACYDIPIEANYRYKAMYSNYKNGKATANIVNVYQKLLILKNVKTNKVEQFILTLIPDKEYERKNKKRVCDKFINCADKGQFSGVAIYTIPQTGLFIRVNRYVHGNKVNEVFLPNKKESLKKRLNRLRSILKGIQLKRKPVISTRSFGEDDWDWSDEYDNNDDWQYDPDRYEAIGGDFFYDPIHDQILIDYDGDGRPDSVWLPEVEITPDSPDEPWPPYDPEIEDPDPTPPIEGPDDDDDGYTVILPIPDKTTPGEEIPDTPCADENNNKSNPMVNMQLAPPSQSNQKGSTFGYTRNNGTKMHSGIDLAGEVGDPVYAAHGGTISKIVSEQPDREGTDNKGYPTDYKGDKNDAGNRIYITVSTGVEDAYFHLQAGTPIATNPQTGAPYEVGDTVEIGDIIGFVGITGNSNPNVPHLHFGVRVSGEWENPIDYINATIDNDETNWSISTPCDEEL